MSCTRDERSAEEVEEDEQTIAAANTTHHNTTADHHYNDQVLQVPLKVLKGKHEGIPKPNTKKRLTCKSYTKYPRAS